jgi:hypothetical protein
VVDDDQELADEITGGLRALRPSGPVSIDAGRKQVLDVLQPYIDNLACAVYKKVKPLHLSLPSLADECPEWTWYQEC